MLKEEIISKIELLAEDQEKYEKFKDYILEFSNTPRCKKGVLEFVRDLYNSQNVEGLSEMAIELFTDKSMRNSERMRYWIFEHPISLGYNQALKDQREVVMCAIAKYIMDTSERIQNSDLDDKAERQVYLRRAVARLRTVMGTKTHIEFDTLDWAEVEPADYYDYLCSSLSELIDPICDKRVIQEWADSWGDCQSLSQVNMLRSLRSYLNYLDTFYQY